MAASDRKRLRIPVVPSVVIAAVIAGLIFWFAYMSRPAPRPEEMQPPSSAEQTYAPHIFFSGLAMTAAENLMRQRVVEVRGDIANHGPRAITSVSVDCTFSSIQGNQVYRERQFAFASKTNPLKPGETRPFRLAFDQLPDNWDQALPRLTVARIVFAGKS
ncbi:MAG: DUF2393 family protein [Bryobacteraceae bacterium]